MITLFTDLDGTLLGGTAGDRQALLAADWRGRSGRLVYVTGRSLKLVLSLVSQGDIPQPDAIIGDVGTSIWSPSGKPLSEQAHLEITKRWLPHGPSVKAEVAHLPGIKPQDEARPRRQSFLYDEQALTSNSLPEAVDRIESKGLDALVSGGCFLDALPRGIHKGWSVQWLMQHWGLRPEAVLVAGDSENDASMLRLALPGVLVGNADEALRRQAPPTDHRVHAMAQGAAGILEGLRTLQNRGVLLS